MSFMYCAKVPRLQCHFDTLVVMMQALSYKIP